ncbi:hypothetical protein ACF07T_28630 [Streptomyces sp. NPDC015184]|uniref:hypothetical protein n=1 Tax=Streptomyces sp. NPDC015184 TaxID=3364946 RepID=UPI0036FEE901
MTGTAGPARRNRLHRLAGVVVLLAPLLVAGSASEPREAPRLAAAADETPVDAGRITYAGTEHRSIGRTVGTTSSDPLFGTGPAHYDEDPFVRGDVMVFTSLRDSVRPQVYVRGADGAVRRLTSDRDAAHPELSPDGRTVVFDSEERGADGTVQRDLWIVDVDGTGLRRLMDTPNNETSPTFSPDGTRVAFSCDSGDGGAGIIYEQAVSGGAARAVSHVTGNATEPAWNPVDDDAHRDQIAYTLTPSVKEDDPRLWVTEGRPGTDRELLAGGQATWRTRSAAWLADGTGLVFLGRDCTCEYERVYRGTAFDTAAPTTVLDENRKLDSPTWTGPLDTGTVIVSRQTSRRPGDKNEETAVVATLQDVRQDGSDPRDLGVSVLWEDPGAVDNADLLFNPGKDYDPWTERQSYTPDGRRIVVTRFEGDKGSRTQQIWLADADGGNAAAMPLAGRNPGDWDTDPAFSPDGTKLAFTRTSPGGVGENAGPSSVLVADVATGAIIGKVVPPAGQLTGQDAQPAWSPDGTTLAFTRNHVIRGLGGIKHIWTAPVNALDQQRDLSARICPGECKKIDDSPAFSPDGTRIAFNRKDGGNDQNSGRGGIVITSPNGDECRVVLPDTRRDDPGACRQDLPDTPPNGPFQPRDVAWSPDGGRLVMSSRREAAPNSPEQLSVLDLSSGTLTPFGGRLAGRQKEPAFQQSVDLSLTAPPTAPSIEVGGTGEVAVTVTNRGPAPSPGTVFTIDAPPGVRLEELTTPAGSCAAASPQCDLGVLRPGRSVTVTARLTGVSTGDQRIGWSVAGAVVDPNPTDNATGTVVPVRDAPAPTPTPTPTPTPAPTPPEPEAGPGVVVRAQPSPGFVGGRVVVTYTVRNGRNALATGLRLRLGLPARVPTGPLPAGCAAGVCTLPDLAPRASTVVRVVLEPDRALRTTITGRLTTTGTDADLRDNVARTTLRILKPRIVAVPAVGKPGFVTSVRGKDFPPGAPVRLTWKPGITAAAPPAVPGADRTFIAQLLVLVKDRTGPRTITATGPGFSPVTTRFLVVDGTMVPPDEVGRR